MGTDDDRDQPSQTLHDLIRAHGGAVRSVIAGQEYNPDDCAIASQSPTEGDESEKPCFTSETHCGEDIRSDQALDAAVPVECGWTVAPTTLTPAVTDAIECR